MTPNTIATLIVGLLFCFIGILACRHYKWRNFKSYVPLFIGILLVLISTIGPLSHGKQIVDKITNIKSQDVSSILLLPTHRTDTKSIVSQPILITDSGLIDTLCKALNHSRITGEGFLKNPERTCIIQFDFKDGVHFSIAMKKKQQATRLDINSNTETGWHYANLTATEFGTVIDAIAR